MEKVQFRVEGLCCTDEMAVLKGALSGKPGVGEIEFDLVNAKIVVEVNLGVIGRSEIARMIEQAGYRATPWEDRNRRENRGFFDRYVHALMACGSGILLAAALICELMSPEIAIYFYLGSLIFGAWFVVPKAVQSAMRLRPDINLLLVIAVVGALFVNEVFEGALTAFLFSVALLLEKWSVGRARTSIAALLEIAPQVASVIDAKSSEVSELNLEDVEIGMHVLVRPGERVPIDGVVVKGESSINEAPITGESLPVHKVVDDPVYAGTINEGGAIECLVQKRSEDSTLSRIIQMVEEAQSKRAKSEQWIERFSVYYTPLMILIALCISLVPPLLFGGVWDEWIYRGLIILVIACPCSLVISTPVAVVSALTASARNGVLIKGGKFIEIPAKLKVVAMDKTGTLTCGRPEVQSVEAFQGMSQREVLDLAAAIEQKSEHPLGRAILRHAKELGRRVVPCDEFCVEKGKGARATVKGKEYWIGSHRMLKEMGAESPEVDKRIGELEDFGHSVVALGDQKGVFGLISVSDTPREGAEANLAAIRAAGVEKVVMLTGDNSVTASALATHCGVDAFHSELLPEDKLAKVSELIDQYGSVAMVGDGINDAPAMATSSLGIAMGAIGTDAAIETADIALMSDDLSKISWLISHSRRTLAIVKQNIFSSVGVKVAFLGLSVAGFTSLWMAVLADTGMSIVVIANSLRLLRKDSNR